MDRKEYIDKVVRIIGIKYKLDELEKEELRLLFDMTPDSHTQPSQQPIAPIVPWDIAPNPIQPPITVMYGCEFSTTSAISTTNGTFVSSETEKGKQ